MKRTVILVFTSLLLVTGRAQLYFPPNSSGTWDTLSPAGMNWCENKIDSLYDFLESNNTKAFILLKNGKIVLEQYFNGHDASSFWYWHCLLPCAPSSSGTCRPFSFRLLLPI